MTQPIIQEKARKGDLVCAMYEKRNYDAAGKFDGYIASYRLAEVMSATRTGRVKTVRDCAVTRGADKVDGSVGGVFRVYTLGPHARNETLTALFNKTGVADHIEMGETYEDAQRWMRRTLRLEKESS